MNIFKKHWCPIKFVRHNVRETEVPLDWLAKGSKDGLLILCFNYSETYSNAQLFWATAFERQPPYISSDFRDLSSTLPQIWILSRNSILTNNFNCYQLINLFLYVSSKASLITDLKISFDIIRDPKRVQPFISRFSYNSFIKSFPFPFPVSFLARELAPFFFFGFFSLSFSRSLRNLDDILISKWTKSLLNRNQIPFNF